MTDQILQHPRVELVSIVALKPNPRNARTHTDKQIAQIAGSIGRFGFTVPLVTDDELNIVGGHGRYEAAKLLKLDKVPAIRVQFLSETDRRAYALAENRIAELSGWDDDLLAEELTFLFEGGFDLEITGFSTSALDFSIPAAAAATEPEEVELPDPSDQAVTMPGDLWTIGPCRLLCGDSRLVESFESLLGGEVADMVFADPPYGVRIDGFVTGHGKVRHREFAMMSGEQTPAELTAFLRAVFRNCVRFSKAGSVHYQCADWRHLREYLDAADGVYSALKNLIVWNKGVGGQGAFYRSQHELILAFKAGNARHTNNFGLGEEGRYRTNVWDYPGVNSFRRGRAQDLEDHPTVKNAAMVADAILDCSNRGDLILDPFSGSGTTLLSAYRTKRRGAAIEIDPLYCDTTIRRLTSVTGLTAIHADGRTFDEVAASRASEKEGTDG